MNPSVLDDFNFDGLKKTKTSFERGWWWWWWVVTFRQNQFMFRIGSEFNFNTFILMNCKLSTRNQELS